MASSKTAGARASVAAAVALSLVAARVLVDHEPLGLKVGHIVEGTQAQIDSLVGGGIADAHPDAVAYAAAQGSVVVQLEVAEAAAPAAADAGAPVPAEGAAAETPADAPAADAAAQDPAA